jgi:hypothetical protein
MIRLHDSLLPGGNVPPGVSFRSLRLAAGPLGREVQPAAGFLFSTAPARIERTPRLSRQREGVNPIRFVYRFE